MHAGLDPRLGGPACRPPSEPPLRGRLAVRQTIRRFKETSHRKQPVQMAYLATQLKTKSCDCGSKKLRCMLPRLTKVSAKYSLDKQRPLYTGLQ